MTHDGPTGASGPESPPPDPLLLPVLDVPLLLLEPRPLLDPLLLLDPVPLLDVPPPVLLDELPPMPLLDPPMPLELALLPPGGPAPLNFFRGSP
jgi:hypothetical protein